LSKVQNNIPNDTRGVDPSGDERMGKTLLRFTSSGSAAKGRNAQVIQRRKEIHPEQVRADYIAAQQKISRLEVENDLLKKLQQSQESQVRKAQELVLKSNTASQIGLGDEDKTIRLNFKALLTSVRDWGRDWAIGDITVIQKLEGPERAEIMQYLAKVVRIDDDELPKGMTSSKKMAARSPALYLSALLANELCDSIIGKPFATHSASSSDPKAPKTSIILEGDRAIDSIYQSLADCKGILYFIFCDG
jgi:hypothetical protein